MFKDIFYLELWLHLCLVERNHAHLFNFSRTYHEEYFEFGLVVQEEMLFRDISYLELLQPFSSVEQNHLCNFGKPYYEEQFCEIILKLDQWLGRK